MKNYKKKKKKPLYIDQLINRIMYDIEELDKRKEEINYMPAEMIDEARSKAANLIAILSNNPFSMGVNHVRTYIDDGAWPVTNKNMRQYRPSDISFEPSYGINIIAGDDIQPSPPGERYPDPGSYTPPSPSASSFAELETRIREIQAERNERM